MNTEISRQNSDADLRLLVVMRHGEAHPSSPHGDEGRELTDAGRRDCEEVGRWLARQGVHPDVALVSSATRTVQTWEAMQQGGLECDDVRHDRSLYNGDVTDLLESLGAVPDTARVVVLVGHAPAVPALALDTVEVHCEPPRSWPPATVGVIGHPASWEGFPADGSALTACRTPRG